MSLHYSGLIIRFLWMGKGMPMETRSCPKGGLAGAGAGFFPPLTPPNRGNSAAPSGSLTVAELRAESRLLITEMLGRVDFFCFLIFSELSQERASGEAQPVQFDQLNNHKQQGLEEGRTPKAGPSLPQWSCHLPTDSCMSGLAEMGG